MCDPDGIPVTSGSSNLKHIPVGPMPFMDFRSVTDTSSPQWSILSEAVPDEYGLMWYDGCLCVAVGQSWGKVGDVIVFEIGGRDFPCVIADMKAYEHTLDGDGWYGLDGHTIEMIVDMDKLYPEALLMGNCRYVPLFGSEV